MIIRPYDGCAVFNGVSCGCRLMKPAMKSKCGWYGALLFSLYMRASFKSCRYPYVNSWFFAPRMARSSGAAVRQRACRSC